MGRVSGGRPVRGDRDPAGDLGTQRVPQTAPVNEKKLGRRQQAVLDAMHRNAGMWPQHWKIRSDHRHIFDGLVQRGILSLDNGVYRVCYAR